MDIFSHFVHTIEPATYTKMMLTAGNMSLGGMGIESTLGQGGRLHMSLKAGKRWGLYLVTNYLERCPFVYTMPL
jgi:hypothetical protein